MDIPGFCFTALRDRRGTALIEFAIAAPVMLALLVGMVGYGQYFLLAHSAQQIANDAARAAIAGMTEDEREAIALTSVADSGRAIGIVDPEDLTSTVDEQYGRVRVDVSVDASGIAILSIPIMPMPPTTIVRHAAARISEVS